VITSERGERVDFDVTAVLAYDVSGLTAGQVVNFELTTESSHQAINVSVQTSRGIEYAEQKFPEIRRLRYVGFEQHGNLRAYQFERISPGDEKQTFAVNIDLVLFKRHHVLMQEGPLLCLWLLSGEMEASGERPLQFSPCSITDRNMLAYVASKPVPRTPGRKSTPRTAALCAQHV
jgi:hypothetical protein